MLRGINVGAHRKIRMADLKRLYEECGFKEIVTYIQSGNVLFKTEMDVDRAILTQQIEKVIAAHYPFIVPVLIRTQTDFDNVLITNPFLQNADLDVKNIYITFLESLPNPLLVAKIQDLDYAPEQWVILEKEVYIYTCDYGKTKLSNSFFENKLKVKATTRNWNTVQQLMALAK
jgi:uncharacterized protein (DUF1697 family)